MDKQLNVFLHSGSSYVKKKKKLTNAFTGVFLSKHEQQEGLLTPTAQRSACQTRILHIGDRCLKA